MKFIFLVVVYNNYVDTVDCIKSIANQDRVDNLIDCVIIDNSDLPSVRIEIDRIAAAHDFATVLRPDINLGYFGAFNYFFERAEDLSESIVILCNNDLDFSQDFCRRIFLKTYPSNILAVCPDVKTIDGVHQNPHVLKPRSRLQRLKLDLYFSNYYLACFLLFLKRTFNIFIRKRNNEQLSLQPGYLHMGIGACYVLLPNFFAKFNRLNYPHFLYGEEAYLTNQVHSAGGALYYDPELKVLHKESATLSKLPRRTTYDFGRDGYWSYRKFY